MRGVDCSRSEKFTLAALVLNFKVVHQYGELQYMKWIVYLFYHYFVCSLKDSTLRSLVSTPTPWLISLEPS
jgi:hypothetical protein